MYISNKKSCFIPILALLLGACNAFKPMTTKPVIDTNSSTNTPNEKGIDNPMPNGSTDESLKELILKDPFLAEILNTPKQYQTQIIYTQINRDANNKPSFKHQYLSVDKDFYFYPASVVKMPIAFLALQKINELNAQGIMIDKNMTMITEQSSEAQTVVYNDPTSADGRPTIAHYIKKIFLVSDNDAYNRLYEFLGQEYINTNLYKLGYKNAEILHRLSVSMSDEENRKTNPIKFLDSTGKLVYEQPEQYNKRKYSKRNDKRGLAYMKGDTKINTPFDFTNKNRLNLNDMHDILGNVLFNQPINQSKLFNLTEADRKFLLQYLSQLPKETTYPSYTAPEYWDAYVKFNLVGSEKKDMPKNIRIFNKVGEAYGYLTDVSYIADYENKIEFMLSATIYVNKDGIFNDDKYEYETVGFPFFKKLGEVIYNYEKGRSKKNAPDLTEFVLPYDK
jgi:Beta-lactamase enzyme family